jgi:hypothetical protein
MKKLIIIIGAILFLTSCATTGIVETAPTFGNVIKGTVIVKVDQKRKIITDAYLRKVGKLKKGDKIKFRGKKIIKIIK